MRSKRGNLTPREAAILIAAGWIKSAEEGKTMDLQYIDDRESFRQQVKSALEKERKKLLARVKCFEEG